LDTDVKTEGDKQEHLMFQWKDFY